MFRRLCVFASIIVSALAQSCNLYGCPCVPQVPFIADCTARMPEYTVSGSHYQIGYSIGTQLKDQITAYINSATTYCVPTSENLAWIAETSDPSSIYSKNLQRLKLVAQKVYPQYCEELQGIIDATGLPENVIWGMNFQDELFVTWLGNQKVARNSNYEKADGCSNVLHVDQSGNVIFGHNEDGDPTMDQGMVLLHVNVNDPKYGDNYNYTVGYYLGMLPGWSFGFNSYGMVIDINSIYPLALGQGLGTAWTSRDVFSAKNMADAIAKAAPFGTSMGASFNLGSTSENVWVNLEGLPNGDFTLRNHTAKAITAAASGKDYFFYHFNDYKKNDIWAHNSPSTQHREANLARLVASNGYPSDVQGVANIIGDTTDTFTAIDDGKHTYVFWRRDPNLDYAFTHGSVIASSNPDNSVTYRVYGTGVNPKTCPNGFREFTVRKLQ